MPRQHIEFTGIVENGHLPDATRQQIASTLKKVEGKRITIAISEMKRARSLSQNAFYWSVVVPQVQDMFTDNGMDADSEEVHSYLKEHVGGLKVILTEPSGGKKTVPGSSRKLTTGQWEDYMTKIRAWAAQFNVHIPLPNEIL